MERAPLISFLYCTVRPEFDCYVEHPEWSNLGRLVEMLEVQTFKNFELIIVDGLHEDRFGDDPRPDCAREAPRARGFEVVHARPSVHSPWVCMRKVAISAYRNTGLAYARGELVVNLDDCCTLPPNYAEAFAVAYQTSGVCLAMCWPGDGRCPGLVEGPGRVFGFGSYPLETALALNGYDEAFDGGQGLEDMDWSWRLYNAGVRQALISLPGFVIEPQAGHSPDAIDHAEPVVKCCNAAWAATRPTREGLLRAGDEGFWGSPLRGLSEAECARRLSLTSPCPLLNADDSCQHHGGRTTCAYLGWARTVREDVREVLVTRASPVVDLVTLRRAAGRS